MKLFRHLSGLALLTLVAVGAAHSDLVASSPAHLATVRTPPAEVTLTFAERVEPRFSSFTVAPLTAEGDEPALLRQAEALLAGGPDAPNALGAEVTTAVTTATASETVALALPAGLEPGSYAVLWRALSEDTHTLQDFIVFTYRP